MLGFYSIGTAVLGSIGVLLTAGTITITPATQVGNVNVPTQPFVVTADPGFVGLIEFATDPPSAGGLFVPPFLLGSGNFRFIPATLGTYRIVVTNTASANNPPPVTITVSLRPAPADIPPPTKTVQGYVKTRAGAKRPNLSGLDWVWFDEARPSAFLAPMDQGSGASTDASGLLQLTVKSNLDVGDEGYLILWDMNGPLGPQQAFSGTRKVS